MSERGLRLVLSFCGGLIGGLVVQPWFSFLETLVFVGEMSYGFSASQVRLGVLTAAPLGAYFVWRAAHNLQTGKEAAPLILRKKGGAAGAKAGALVGLVQGIQVLLTSGHLGQYGLYFVLPFFGIIMGICLGWLTGIIAGCCAGIVVRFALRNPSGPFPDSPNE